MGLTDTIRNKVNSLFNFDSQQQSNQLKNKIDTLYGKQNTTTAPNINGYSNELSESDFAVKEKKRRVRNKKRYYIRSFWNAHKFKRWYNH